MHRDEIPTPALLLDLDRFERNITRMATHVRAAGKQLRPHAKTHRCPEIARRQVAAGALGVACAKLGEAEVMARAGVRGHAADVALEAVEVEEQRGRRNVVACHSKTALTLARARGQRRFRRLRCWMPLVTS